MNKSTKFIAVLVAACASFGLAACSGKDTPTEHEHNWVKSGEVQATCGEAGTVSYTCSCGETKTEKSAATGRHNLVDGRCSVCGYADMSGMTEAEAIAAYGFYHDDKDESNTYTLGDRVLFGSYPQSMLGSFEKSGESDAVLTYTTEERAIADELEAAQGTLPTADDKGDWESYGYYDCGESADYAFYKDVTLSDGSRYRGVYLLKYRPYFSGFAAYDGQTDMNKGNSVIYEGGFGLGETYWFEYSPIGWQVLGYEQGKLLLNAEICLDSQPFQTEYGGTTENVVIPDTQTPVNDYTASTVRSFLNDAFLNAAFTDAQQSLIATTTLDNSTTGVKADNEYQVNQAATEDKVFLLSYQDMLNVDYGFTAKASYEKEVQDSEDAKNGNYDAVPDAMIRRRSYTAYSTIQGLHISVMAHALDGGGACWYLLRSAGTSSYAVAGVNKYGSVIYSRPVNLSGVLAGTDPTSEDALAICGNYGILPSLYLEVNDEK